MEISAEIAGRSVGRDQVLAWEAKRAAQVATKVGAIVPPSGLADLRQAIVDRKLELGHDAIERLLSRELRWSARVGRTGAAASRGRRKFSTIELQATAGAAEMVPQWYHWDRKITHAQLFPDVETAIAVADRQTALA